MMSRHFRLSSELTGAIAKRLPHAKNQLSVHDSFFNQFVKDIYIYMYTLGLPDFQKAKPGHNLFSKKLTICTTCYCSSVFD